MSEHNSRKEPTFGDTPRNEKERDQAKVSFSLHSTQSPGYTFTPVMKRPKQTAQELSTLEEKAMLNQTHQPAESEKPKNNGGFAFAPVAEKDPVAKPEAVTAEPVVAKQPTADAEKPEGTDKPLAAASAAGMERVIPSHSPVTPKKAEKVPPTYRRLLIVLLLLLALLLAFFLLKPKTPETVETLQEQGTSLPIEFRPVDEQEAKRAEEQARLEAEQAKAEQAKAAEQAAMEANANANAAQTQPASEPQTVESTPAVASQADTATPAVQAVDNTANVANATKTTDVVAVAKPTVSKPAVSKPVVIEPAKKPNANGSVIYQPESKTASTMAAAKPAVKVETAKPAVAPSHSKPEAKVEKVVAKAVEVKPTAPASAPASVAIVSSKTMTVPKGVSLMQVFRDHGMEGNLPDVNAMSKVNNIVSNLKVGEKITVRLDKNGKVAEMLIGSGGRFIRQANGSYLYQ